MPVYMHCPHCDHPQVVPVHRRGRMRFCRQCGRAYVTSKFVADVHPVPVGSMAEMHAASGAGRARTKKRVYVLD